MTKKMGGLFPPRWGDDEIRRASGLLDSGHCEIDTAVYISQGSAFMLHAVGKNLKWMFYSLFWIGHLPCWQLHLLLSRLYWM